MKASLPMRLFWGFALAVNLGAVALDVWLFFYATHRWYQPILGAANLGCAAFFVWRFIWDFRQRRTLKSSPPSQSLSSFLAFQSNGPTPLPSQPSSPSTSRSLPSVTIDQPVVGFRQWKLIGGNGLQLLPLAYDAWPWGATTIAKCGMAQSHPAPQAGCSCGLYAHFAPAGAVWPASGMVSGAVLASGRILRHPAEGIRAEKMRILALARPVLQETTLEPCPERGRISASTLVNVSSATRRMIEPLIPTTRYGDYLIGHGWTTEDRELNLPNGTHRFKAKIKCEHCGCGPEREYTVTDHTPELAHLEAIAQHFGVPLVPIERISAYAAEFGIIATEVRALGA